MTTARLSETVDLYNSSAFISVQELENSGKVGDSDSNCIETAFVDGDSVIVLNGDHRAELKKILDAIEFPYLAVRDWFRKMEMEWGSSWSEKSSVENWNLERGLS